MTTTVKTPFVRIVAEDVLPGFDPNEPPDPAPYWDNETLEISDEWSKIHSLWATVKTYEFLHRLVPVPEAYEIPKPALSWADAIIAGGPVKPLLLYGPVGVGKTHGACALACYLGAFWDRRLFTGGPPIAFHTASLLLSGLKNFGSGDRRDELFHQVTTAKVLVIDDLTRFKSTDYDMESLGQVIDTRQANRLPTVVTLNDMGPDDLSDQIPPFLASRLLSGNQAPIFGTDRRA
jgi:hypothetical protein